jgi:hypothetical protein
MESTGKLSMGNYMDGVGSYTTGNTAVNDGNWHNLVIINNTSDNTQKLFIDGNNTPEINHTLTSGTKNAQPIQIGYYATAGGYVWNGSIDQVRFYNIALSSSNITALYNETAATASTLDFPAGAGCVAGYTFDTNADNVGFDTTTDVSTCNFPTGAGCQLLYQFDNNVTDTCGSYDGTAGGTLIYSNGVFGSAVNTTSGYLDTGYTMPADSTMSISFWMKMTANPGSDVYLFSDMDSGTSNRRLDVRIGGSYSNKLYIDNGDGSSNNQQDTGWIPTEDVWYNVVITFNGTAVILYINGVSTYSYTSSVALGTAGGQTQVIGRAGHYACCNFPGLIDQFRIFTSTLTQSQVTELARGAQYNGASSNVVYNGFLNFQPDLVWLKSRTSTTWHNLQDSIRGATKHIYSNANNSEDTTATGFTSFDPTGFTLGSANGFNTSGADYVSWNWKAGNTSAAAFNGSSSVIDISSSTINVGTPYTISMWLNFSDVTAYKGVFANITSSRLTNEIAVVLNNGKITIYSVVSNGNTNLDAINATPQSAIANNTWYNVVIVADRSLANKAQVYFNGVETSYTYSAGVAGTAAYSDTKIGLADGVYFDGKINQVRLFNTVLSSTQASALYNETASNNNTLNFPAGAGCTAAYTLNSTVADVGGNYNGTPTAITYAKPGYTGVNNDGSVESQVSANQDSGFSIVKYIGNNTSGATIGHGLNALPHTIVVKRIDSTGDWIVYNNDLGATKYLLMNSTAGAYTASNVWNDTAPTSTVFSIGNYAEINTNAGDYIAYCWTSVAKYSKIGSYAGNRPTTVTVNTGFEPAWIMIKDTTNNGEGWVMIDNKRGDELLEAQSTSANTSYNSIQFTSTGFTAGDSGLVNSSGATIIYMAFAVPLT